MRKRYKVGKKPKATKSHYPGKTIPGLSYKIGDLVRKFEAGGTVSSALLREGEYHQHGSIPPEGHADYIDLTDAAAVAQAAREAEVKAKEKEIADKKAKAQKEFDDKLEQAIQERLSATTNQNDDAE